MEVMGVAVAADLAAAMKDHYHVTMVLWR